MRPIAAIRLWFPVLAVMGLLFFLSSQPTLPGIERFPDKLAHATAYFVLGLLCLRATHGGLYRPRPWPSAVSFALCLSYAAIEEWHQSLVPGRDPSAGDWTADLVGLCVALLALRVISGSARKVRDSAESAGRE